MGDHDPSAQFLHSTWHTHLETEIISLPKCSVLELWRQPTQIWTHSNGLPHLHIDSTPASFLERLQSWQATNWPSTRKALVSAGWKLAHSLVPSPTSDNSSLPVSSALRESEILVSEGTCMPVHTPTDKLTTWDMLRSEVKCSVMETETDSTAHQQTGENSTRKVS